MTTKTKNIAIEIAIVWATIYTIKFIAQKVYLSQPANVTNNQAFMKSCNTGEYDGEQFDQEQYCTCAYKRLDDEYGIKNVTKDFLNMSEDDSDDKYNKVYEACLAEQGF